MANNKKISEFTQQTAFLQTDLVNIVRSSTNFTVPVSALPTFLGVTGTINVVGGTGSAVLEQPSGTVNNIRNLEDGNGILTTISAQNGITINHNFTQDTTGIVLVDDLATASPTFPSFIPGNGIQISRNGDAIAIAATGALPATRVVTVNSISDFPTAAAGVITLDGDTVYVISNIMSTSDRFIMGERTSVVSYSGFGPLLTYTGSGTMFTAVDVSCVFLHLHLSAPSGGKIFDISGAGTPITVSIDSVNIDDCDDIGTFTSIFAVVMRSLTSLNSDNGVNFVGTGFNLISVISMAVVTTDATFIGIDLGTAVSENIDIINPGFVYPAGATGISGAASNGNLTATGLGTLTEAGFIGVGMPIVGLSINDVRWLFRDNQNIADTKKDSLSVNTAGTTVTIGTQSVPVKIAGTWINVDSSHFAVDGTGTVTFIGNKDLHVPIDISVTADPVSGGAKDFAICVAINGTAIPNSCVPSRAASGDLMSVSIHWQHVFEPNDTIEVFIQNDTDTVDFNVSNSILRVN